MPKIDINRPAHVSIYGSVVPVTILTRGRVGAYGNDVVIGEYVVCVSQKRARYPRSYKAIGIWDAQTGKSLSKTTSTTNPLHDGLCVFDLEQEPIRKSVFFNVYPIEGVHPSSVVGTPTDTIEQTRLRQGGQPNVEAILELIFTDGKLTHVGRHEAK